MIDQIFLILFVCGVCAVGTILDRFAARFLQELMNQPDRNDKGEDQRHE